MLIALYILTIVLSPFFKRKKWNWVFYAIVLCIMFWSSNGTYTDFEGYYQIFERINSTGINIVGASPGWFALCMFFGRIGLNYFGMSIALLFFSCFLMHRLFSIFETNENITWAALLVFPILINGIQIRFFLAMAIVTYCLKYLLFDNKVPLIKFLLGVAIATSIHTASVIFIICVLVLLYERHKFKTNVLITILLCALILVGVAFVPTIAKKFLNAWQYSRYISDSTSESSIKWVGAITVCWFAAIAIFQMMKLTKGWHNKTILNRNVMVEEGGKIPDKNDYEITFKRIFRIIYLLGLTLPLLIFDRNYHRYIQLGYILDAMCLGIYWYRASGGNKIIKLERWLVIICFFIALIPAIYSYEFVPVNAIAPLFEYVKFPSILR